MNTRLLDSLLKRLGAGPQAQPVQGPCASGRERSVLIFDRSGSMSFEDYPPTRLLAAFDAGMEFITARKGRGLPDLVSIILFDTEAEFICQDIHLNEAGKVLTSLKEQAEIGGGTDINSGLIAAERHFHHALQGYKNRIVLLTDGHGGNPVRTGKRLREAGVVIDIIGVAGEPILVAEEQLRQVASVINGISRYRFIGNRAELLRHFQSIATDLMQVY